MPQNLRANTIQTWDRVRGGEQFHRYHDIATNWQTYGIDYDDSLTDIETDNNVVVPESQIQLTDHQLQELQNRIDPLSDDGNNGINHFLDTVAIMEGFIEMKNNVLTSNQTYCQPPCDCLLYTSPSPRDQRGSRMPSSA